MSASNSSAISQTDILLKPATLSLPLFNRDLFTRVEWLKHLNNELEASELPTAKEFKHFFSNLPIYRQKRTQTKAGIRNERGAKILLELSTEDRNEMMRVPAPAICAANDWKSLTLMGDALLYLHRAQVNVQPLGGISRCFSRPALQESGDGVIQHLEDIYKVLCDANTAIESLRNTLPVREVESDPEVRVLQLVQMAKSTSRASHGLSILSKFMWIGVWYALCLSGETPTRQNIQHLIGELATKHKCSALMQRDALQPKVLACTNLVFQYNPLIGFLHWSIEAKPVADDIIHKLYRSLAPNMDAVTCNIRARVHKIAYDIAVGVKPYDAIIQGVGDCLTHLSDVAAQKAVTMWLNYEPDTESVIDWESKSELGSETSSDEMAIDEQTKAGEGDQTLGKKRQREDRDDDDASGMDLPPLSDIEEDEDESIDTQEQSEDKRKDKQNKPPQAGPKKDKLEPRASKRTKRDSSRTASQPPSLKRSGGGKLSARNRIRLGQKGTRGMTEEHARDRIHEDLPRVFRSREQMGARVPWGSANKTVEVIDLCSDDDVKVVKPRVPSQKTAKVSENDSDDLLLCLQTFTSDGQPVSVEYRALSSADQKLFKSIEDRSRKNFCSTECPDKPHPRHTVPLWKVPKRDSQFKVMTREEFESMDPAKLQETLKAKNIVVRGGEKLVKEIFHEEGFTLHALSQLGDLHTRRQMSDQTLRTMAKPNEALRMSTLARLHALVMDPTSKAVMNALDIPQSDGPFAAPPRYFLLAHDYKAFCKDIPALPSVRMTAEWQWGTAATKGTSSWPHIDADGCCTYTVFTGSGGKVWYMLRSEQLDCSLAAGLKAFDPNRPWVDSKGEWESIYLMPGDYLIQKPNQIHAVVGGTGCNTKGEIGKEGNQGGTIGKGGHFLNWFTIKDTVHGFLQCRFHGESITNQSHEAAVIQAMRRMICWLGREMRKRGDETFNGWSLCDGFTLDNWENVSSVLALLNLHDSLAVLNDELSGVSECEDDDFEAIKQEYLTTCHVSMAIREMLESSLDLYIDGEAQEWHVWKIIMQESLAHMLALLHSYSSSEVKKVDKSPRWKELFKKTAAYLKSFDRAPQCDKSIHEMYEDRVKQFEKDMDGECWTVWDTCKFAVKARETQHKTPSCTEGSNADEDVEPEYEEDLMKNDDKDDGED